MQNNKLSFAVALSLGFCTSSIQAVTINWIDGPGAGNATLFAVGTGLTTPSAINSLPFTLAGSISNLPGTPSEFRMLSPSGLVGGGGEKTPIRGTGDQSWTFADPTGLMTGTGSAFPGNPGSTVAGSAAPTANTNPSLDMGSNFKGPNFVFLAPTTTSLAGAAYGAASIAFTSGDNFSILFPTLEFQWGGAYFPLGLNTGGVSFDCVGALSGNVHCAAEHTLSAAAGEDPGVAGFDAWTAQWNFFGTMTPHAVPVPAAVWLFGSGLVGLVGMAHRLKRNTTYNQ